MFLILSVVRGWALDHDKLSEIAAFRQVDKLLQFVNAQRLI